MYFAGERRGQMLWEPTNVWKHGGKLHHDHATHQTEDYSWAKNCFFLILLITIVSPYHVPIDTSL